MGDLFGGDGRPVPGDAQAGGFGWQGITALHLHAPEMRYDQPAGAPRLVQRADGYIATILSGVPVHENGEATGDLPGRLIRGAR